MAVTLPFSKLEPFGAEIQRDLSEPFAPSEAFHFKQLFDEYKLVLARGQQLTMDRQRELCALIGPILLRKGEDGYMTNESGGPSASAYCWHADAAYTEHPFDALSLHAIDVVDDASSTRFANAEEAYDSLPAALSQTLEKSEQEMISPHYTLLAERTCDRRDPEALKQGILPAIFVNPHNGRKCVWVSEMQTSRLLNMEWEQSRDLLHQAYDHLYAPERVLEHRWRKGDLIIWDNIALQHARPDVSDSGRRLLQRVIVGTQGEVPHYEGD
ncbi:MAG: TauD/TfdA family dioxygenase [Novosphingobium sp.]|nr:TauD/TfdA family dioxygenase [Novosphingobium sp.]